MRQGRRLPRRERSCCPPRRCHSAPRQPRAHHTARLSRRQGCRRVRAASPRAGHTLLTAPLSLHATHRVGVGVFSARMHAGLRRLSLAPPSADVLPTPAQPPSYSAPPGAPRHSWCAPRPGQPHTRHGAARWQSRASPRAVASPPRACLLLAPVADALLQALLHGSVTALEAAHRPLQLRAPPPRTEPSLFQAARSVRQVDAHSPHAHAHASQTRSPQPPLLSMQHQRARGCDLSARQRATPQSLPAVRQERAEVRPSLSPWQTVVAEPRPSKLTAAGPQQRAASTHRPSPFQRRQRGWSASARARPRTHVAAQHVAAPSPLSAPAAVCASSPPRHVAAASPASGPIAAAAAHGSRSAAARWHESSRAPPLGGAR
mmetsp:Transcript_16290/g.36472  ORF Transcript_16290/g.36472 Transcript_16290/m.36472 type:complete len:375 (-) Transcript_16290:448-1572(-)